MRASFVDLGDPDRPFWVRLDKILYVNFTANGESEIGFKDGTFVHVDMSADAIADRIIEREEIINQNGKEFQ